MSFANRPTGNNNSNPSRVIRHFLWMAFVICALSASAFATPKPEQPFINGQLPPQESDFFDHYYAIQQPQYSIYKKVYIADPLVTFDKRWQKDFRLQLRPNYPHYATATYGKLLKEELQKAFSENSNYQQVNNAEEAELIVSSALTDFYIFGPETIYNTQYFVRTVARGTFRVTVEVSKGELLGQFIDTRETRDYDDMNLAQPANRATNYRDIKLLFQKWSAGLVEHLK